MSDGLEILSVAEIAAADRAAMAAGVAGRVLMERAGEAVADAVSGRWSPRRTVVLCGPGANGGDGFVAARKLAQAGWPVTCALLGEPGTLGSDAALAAADWQGATERFGPEVLEGAELVIDALFGAGLSRPLGGDAQAVMRAA